MADEPRFETVAFDAHWPALREEWANLFARSARPCPFYHPRFLDAAREGDSGGRGGGGGGTPTHLVLGRRGEEVVFGLPARHTRVAGVARRVELWTRRGFDHLAPLDTATDRSNTSAWIAASAGGRAFDLVSATALDGSEAGVLAAEGAFVRPGFRCPYLDLPGSVEGLWSHLSANMRSGLRRKARAAEQAGVELEVLDHSAGAAGLQRAFDELVRLHELRSHEVGRTSAFLRPSSVEFHRRLVCRADGSPNPTVRFVEARAGARVLATLYGFRLAGSFLFFQSGLDPAAADLSLGTQVMFRSMRLAIDEGAVRYDFLRGADEYKARWTTTETRDLLVHRPLTAAGRLGVAWLRARRASWRYGRWKGLAAVLRGRD